MTLPDDNIRKRAKKVVDAGSVTLAQLQESISTNELLQELVNKPEMEMPEHPKEMAISNLPEYPTEISVSNFPEVQKVEVFNFPEQKAPIVNVEAPIVNVEAPSVHMNHEEVVSELQNIAGILSQEEPKEIEQTEIIDKDGEVVNWKELFRELMTKVGIGGGSPSIVNIPSVITTRTDPTDTSSTFATQIDDVSTASVTYVGKARIGSSASSAVWQIQKIDESGSPITTVITWANGNPNFTNAWSDRTSLTYN